MAKTKKQTEYDIPVTDTKLIRVKVDTFKGTRYLQVAQMWRREEDPKNDWKYSKKMLTIEMEIADEVVPELTEALKQMLNQ